MKPNSMYITNDDGEPALTGRIVCINVVPGVIPAPDRGDGFVHWEKTGRLDVSAELATNEGDMNDEPKPGETWYAQLDADRPDVVTVYVLNVTQHTIKFTMTSPDTFPSSRTRRVARDAARFVERVENQP